LAVREVVAVSAEDQIVAEAGEDRVGAAEREMRLSKLPGMSLSAWTRLPSLLPKYRPPGKVA
jgi:hypothetical protein